MKKLVPQWIGLLLTPFFLLACASTNKAATNHIDWRKATQTVVGKYEDKVNDSLEPYFLQANVSYPPQKIALLAFKKESDMELWAQSKQGDWRYIKKYPLTAKSGRLGPKLKENDNQIPEGIYNITGFNPFSALHLSMKLNYPNAFDKAHAAQDGRSNLGYDIFIHGKNLSVGCLAIGDEGIDQLFVLVNKVGRGNTEVVIAPNDLRKAPPATNLEAQPQWVSTLYDNLSAHLQIFSV